MKWVEELRIEVPAHVLVVIDHVWKWRHFFVHWPKRGDCFWLGCVRIKYHKYTVEQRARLTEAGVKLDARSNGPAIMSFLLAGGDRPSRLSPRRQWSVHHIYDGKFPAPGRSHTTHAVKDKHLFTHSAGLVAVHPIADALADEVPYFAWLLRREAYERFQFDPDQVFGVGCLPNPSLEPDR